MKGKLWKNIEIDEKVLIKNSVSEEWIPAHGTMVVRHGLRI